MLKSLLELDLKTWLIIALTLIVVLMKTCDTSEKSKPANNTVKVGGKPYEIVKYKIDTVRIPHTTTVYKRGATVYRDTTIYVKTPINVDTLSIIREYHAKKVYLDTLKLSDSLGYVVVNDTISKNSLLGRRWTANVNKITIKETTIIKEKQRRQVYVGLIGGFDRVNVVNFAGTSVLLKNKRDQAYSVAVGYSADRTVSVQGAMYWKIKLKK